MPYDVAFLLPDDEAAAYAIVFGELDGAEFCTATMKWKDPR